MIRLFLALSLILLPTLALAGPPAAGTYLSQDMGGLMYNGRFSESFVGGGPGQLGNTINAASFDGVTLGSQWSLGCVSIEAAPTVLSDTRDDDGNGSVVYFTQYDDGVFFLDANGPWGDGSEDYTGIVFNFENTSTHQYIFGNLAGVISNVTVSGMFDGYGDCFDFAISNSATLGTSPSPMPANYPDFLDDSCNTGPTIGAWGTVPTIRLNILGSCAVTNETTSFGTLKARW